MRHIAVTALILAGLGPADAQGRSDMEARSAAIAQRYLAVWSAGGTESVSDVPYIYGRSVRFFGRTYSQRELAAEKQRAIRRWPVRSYVHRPVSMQVICNEAAQKCAVRSIVDYRVSNPRTGRAARGATSFDLGISFAGSRPVILYEAGGKLRRGADR